MHAPKLDSASEAAVDRLLEDGLDAASTGNDQERERALRDLLGLLEDYPVEDASDELLDATLARVDRHESEQSRRMHVEEAQISRPFSRWRFPDLVASAAALFLAVGIGWPVWQSIQNHRLQDTSSQRLSSIGTAIAGFSGDNAGKLPLDQSLLGNRFDPVSQPHSQHLINTLPKGEYLSRNLLFLVKSPPPNASACFSYRVPGNDHTTFRLILLGSNAPLAGDRNPILWHIRKGDAGFEALEGSPTHNGRGQVILQADGATRWDPVPMHGMDPIWTTLGCPTAQIPMCQPAHDQDTLLAD